MSHCEWQCSALAEGHQEFNRATTQLLGGAAADPLPALLQRLPMPIPSPQSRAAACAGSPPGRAWGWVSAHERGFALPVFGKVLFEVPELQLGTDASDNLLLLQCHMLSLAPFSL